MNCEEFERSLAQCVDHRQTPGQLELLEHAAHCAACAVLWDDFLIVNQAIDVWRQRDIHVALVDRIVNTLRDEGLAKTAYHAENNSRRVQQVPASTISRTHTVRTWPVIAAVALVLIAVSLTFVSRTGHPPLAKRDHAVPRSDLTLPIGESADRLDELLTDAKSAWLGLARTTAQRASDLRVFVPELRSADNPLVPLPGETPSEVNDIPAVPQELQRAFELLFEAAQAGTSQTT